MSDSREWCLEVAASIGARVCRDALWDGRRCTWLGASMEFIGGRWQPAQRACGPDFYGGTSGIALFLARLFRATSATVFRTAAMGAAEQALSRVDTVYLPARIGFYTGWTGIAYSLLELGETLEAERWVERGRRLLVDLARETPDGREADVIGGSAGAIPALLDAYALGTSDALLAFAIREGERLVAAATRGDAGWSWAGAVPGTRHLTGMGHGAAGIAWGLLELYRATGDARFRLAAEEGFRYERSCYHPAHENWPDYRVMGETGNGAPPEPAYGVAWCYGAAGIGLTRLRAHEILGDATNRLEAEAAVRTTRASLPSSAVDGGPLMNWSLCHGLAGNAELLLAASDAFADADSRAPVDRLAKDGYERHHVQGVPWPCGVNDAWEAPSLLLGLAGIGHFYLRLYDAACAPSVLLVAPRSDRTRRRASGLGRQEGGVRMERVPDTAVLTPQA